MWCVVGLGNPGARYQRSRHNLGFMVLDAVAALHGAPWRRTERYHHCAIEGAGLLLVKPQTFMNACGPVARRYLGYRNLGPASLLAVCDDINLPLGQLRLRAGGSDGGHRGLRSLIGSLGTDGFPRLRLGVSLNPGDTDSADYVLAAFRGNELPLVKEMLERAADGLDRLDALGLPRVMNEINAKKSTIP